MLTGRVVDLSFQSMRQQHQQRGLAQLQVFASTEHSKDQIAVLRLSIASSQARSTIPGACSQDHSTLHRMPTYCQWHDRSSCCCDTTRQLFKQPDFVYAGPLTPSFHGQLTGDPVLRCRILNSQPLGQLIQTRSKSAGSHMLSGHQPH